VVHSVLIEIEAELAEVFEAPVVIIHRKPFIVERRRLHLPFPPAAVVLVSGQDNGCIGLGASKVFVAPMGREKAGHTRVVDLQRQHQP
jgi:hypothetical protein